MKPSSIWLYEQLTKEFKITGHAGLSGRDGYLRPFFCSGKEEEEKRSHERNRAGMRQEKRPERDKIKNRREHVCVIPVASLEEIREMEGQGAALGSVPDKTFRVYCISDFRTDGAGGAEKRSTEPDIDNVTDRKTVHGGAYVCVETDGSPFEVLNYLQEAFDLCDDWERRASGLLAENAGIGKVLELSAEFLGNPLMVMGADFSLVAETGMDKLPERARLFSDDGINVEYMNALLQDAEYQRVAQAKSATLFPGYISGYRSVNRNLFVDGQPTHRLVLTECDNPVTQSCFCILETLAAHLEYQLSREAPSSMKGDLETIFQRILSDRTADYVQVSRRLSAAGWSGSDEYLCLILQITYLNQKQLSTRAICRYIQKQLRDSVSFLYQEEVVSFFNLTRLGMNEEEAAAKLVYFIRDSYLKAGYSRTMRGHMNLRRQYVQARTALDVGSRKKPYLWIHHFDQVALTYIIEQATRRL
ncbi:MAG: hypothetical protein LUI07_01420, partial [Lachnospiraceae bacterium]|nr:hypothetical protein [Lachnospiraceae bacterium]